MTTSHHGRGITVAKQRLNVSSTTQRYHIHAHYQGFAPPISDFECRLVSHIPKNHVTGMKSMSEIPFLERFFEKVHFGSVPEFPSALKLKNA